MASQRGLSYADEHQKDSSLKGSAQMEVQSLSSLSPPALLYFHVSLFLFDLLLNTHAQPHLPPFLCLQRGDKTDQC